MYDTIIIDTKKEFFNIKTNLPTMRARARQHTMGTAIRTGRLGSSTKHYL